MVKKWPPAWKALLKVAGIEMAKLDQQQQQLPPPPPIAMELELELEGPHDHDHDHDHHSHINDDHVTSTSYSKNQQHPLSLLAIIIEDFSVPKKKRGSGHKFLGTSKKARQQEALLDTFKLGKTMTMATTTTDQETNWVFSKSENDDHMPREQALNTEKLLKRPMVIQEEEEEEEEENNIMHTRKKIKGSDGLIMPSEEELSDGTKEEWVQVTGPKRSSGASTSNNNKLEKKKKRKKIGGRGVRVCNIEIPNPSRELPDEFKRRISEMEGTNITLVITKRLTDTDCDGKEQRLSMPFTKLRASDFLEGNEKDSLHETDKSGKKKGISVRLIEPNLGEIEINLRQWDMPKKSGGGSSMYVLVKPWKDVVRENGLKAGDAIQVWSFRVGNNKLRLALVKLPQ